MQLYDPKPLTVTVATARKISGLGNTTVWALIKARKLEAVHVGRRTLITFRSLEALLAPPSAAQPNSLGGVGKSSNDIGGSIESLLLPDDAAKIFNLSTSWLAKARMTGEGPEFVKIGRAVGYSK